MNKPNKIRSYETAHEFYYYLVDNQVSSLQGYELSYQNNNILMTVDGYGNTEYLDIDWLWNNRKVVNDFINYLWSL